jgi:hypothetical protein
MTPADELRTAATHIREVAAAARPVWLDVGVAVVAGDDGVPFTAPDVLADHIATWSPDKADLVADWLEATAGLIDARAIIRTPAQPGSYEFEVDTAALALARALHLTEEKPS